MPRIKTNNIFQYYEIRGQGEPLILLMGLGSDHTAWEPHVAAFEKEFKCVLIDNRGAGRSDKPDGPYTCNQMAMDTFALMDALNIESAFVNGCSMGAAIAQSMAVLNAGRVRKLVLTASFPKLDAYATRLCENFENAYRALSPVEFKMLANMIIYSRDYYNANADKIYDAEKSDDSHMPLDAYLAQAAACKSHDVFDSLQALSIPTLIYAAENDDFVSMDTTLEMVKRIPFAKLIVAKGRSHAFHFEIAQEYNEQVIQFLRN